MEVITAGKVVSVFFDVVCGELLSVIKKVWTRSKQFKPLLEQLKSTVERITPIFEDIESLNEDVLWPATQTAALGKQLDEAKDLVGKCDRARWWNKSSYAKKLIDYDKSFTRFFQIDVPAQILHGVRRVEKNQAREWVRVRVAHGVPQPEEALASYIGEPEDPIALLRNSPQFQALRPLLKKNPRLLELTLQGLEKKYPDIFGRNKEHEAAFRKLIDEPVDGSDGHLSDQPEQETPPAISVSHAEQEMPHTISVILAEQEAVERLEEMGFDSDLVIEAFLACDGNEELAVNYLLENAGYFED